MAREPITPITAWTKGEVIYLVDREGDQQAVTMPNVEGALFCATAIRLECNRARRAGE